METAQELLSGAAFKESANNYDWLGRGIYFWENDVLRAYDWARKKRLPHSSVVGVVIDLGHCLDLTTQNGITAVKVMYDSFVMLQIQTKQPMPVNEDPPLSRSGDLVLRHLDRAVIDHLNNAHDKAARRSGGRSFDTIRALFPEGRPLYPNAGFREATHVQICVRAPEQILGVFRIPEHQRRTLGLPLLYDDTRDPASGFSIAAESD